MFIFKMTLFANISINHLLSRSVSFSNPNPFTMKTTSYFLSVFFLAIVSACGSSKTVKDNKTNDSISPTSVSYAAVNGDKINIREKPTIDSKVLGMLNKGDQVEIIETGIQGRSSEAILKKTTSFYYDHGMGDFAWTVNKGRAVKILSFNEETNEYDIFIYMKGKKVLAIVREGDLDMLEGETWMKFKTKNEGITGYCLEKYISNTNKLAQETNKENPKVSSETYKSNDLGYVEYMKRVVFKDGSYEWYYYTDKKPEEQKLGSTEKDGFEAVYFFKNPKVIYEIGGSECGFYITDPKNVTQFYYMVDPPCDMQGYGDPIEGD